MTDSNDRRTVETSSARQPWQEALGKLTTVPASKVLEASDVMRGFAGSWASQWIISEGAFNDIEAQIPTLPSSQQVYNYLIGQPGLPEINFPPYAHGTNRMTSKGGALLGDPISFSVVGPTLKTSYNDWQWQVTTQASPQGVQDVFKLDTFDIYGNGPGAPTLADIYGITNLPIQFPGGLYLMVTMTGHPGDIDGDGYNDPGGIGDGFVYDHAGAWNPIEANTPASRTEIFRVVEINADELILDPKKPLGDYFSMSGDFHVARAVTLIEPKATRLVAIPDSGPARGEEQVFVVVPSERASHSDQQYPFVYYVSAAFTEYGGGFPSDNTTTPLQASFYSTGPALPIKRPIGLANGRLWGEVGDPAPIDLGSSVFPVFIPNINGIIGVTSQPDMVGKIIHIAEIQVRGVAELAIAPDGKQEDLTRLIGWFEIVLNPADEVYLLRRIDEVDPVTGHSFFGPSLAFYLEPGAPVGDGISLRMSVHEPIPFLWNSTYLDIDKLESARLTNLIDPEWVGRATKIVKVFPGVTPARPDRAIFDTSSSGGGTIGTNANPGNLEDLGFRMVLFPAKEWVGPSLIPDWDHPITSNEVLLDPSVPTEDQYIEVDYSNGTVRLSHPPRAGGVFGSVISDPVNNPRGEMVIFAACVPYSQEEGQTGSGIRVTGSPGSSTSGCSAEITSLDFQDVYGERVVFPIQTNPPQTITPDLAGFAGAPGPQIILDGEFVNELPSTGYLEIVWGTEANGVPAWSGSNVRASLLGYTAAPATIVPGETILTGLWGGLPTVVGPGGPITVDDANPAVMVLRRNAVAPAQENGRTFNDYQYDTSAGSRKRSKAIHFADADVQANVDGSVTVKARGTLATANQETLGDLFSSWVLRGGEVSPPIILVAPTYYFGYSEVTYLYQGRRVTLPAGTVGVPAILNPGKTFYVYIDVEACEVTYTDELPLLSPEDILLAKVFTEVGPNIGTVLIDMRYLMTDIDRRLTVVVGQYASPQWDSYSPHFTTLRAAVDYCNEIMTPEFPISPADHIKPLKILVAGSTYETITDQVPIQIKTDGLIVEGAPWATGMGISWDDDTAPLIDFNGHHDVVFRDLVFHNLAEVPDPAQIYRVLFTNSVIGSNCERAVIENVRLTGYASAFLTVIQNASSFGGWNNSHFVNNWANELSIGGIMGWNSFTLDKVMNHCEIRGNTFIQEIGVGAILLSFGGITVLGDDNIITENTMTRFDFGVASITGGDRNTILNNYIYDTYFFGILGDGDDTRVLHNFLMNVYSEATPKVGIALPGTRGIASENFVSLDSPGAGDYDINATGAACMVTSNPLTHALLVDGADSIVDGNRVGENLYIQAGCLRSIIKGNSVVGTLGVAAGAVNCAVKGNVVGAKTDILSTGCAVTGNQIAANLNLGDNFNVVTGNVIGVDIQVTGDDCTMMGNDVRNDIVVPNTSRNNIIGNRVGNEIRHPGGGGVSFEIVVANRVVKPNGVFGAAAIGPGVDNNLV